MTIYDPNPDGNHTPQQISEQVAHLRLLADNYDGVDAEDWSSAADTIERLDALLRGREGVAALACELLDALKPWQEQNAAVRTAATRLTIALATSGDAA